MSEVPTIRASLVAAAALPQRAARPARPAWPRRRVITLALASALASTAVLVAATGGPGSNSAAPSPVALRAAVGRGSVAGDDVWRAARAITAATPHPPGATVSVAWVAPLAGAGRPVARLTLAATVERRAMCEWYRYWLGADGNGRRTASAVIEQIPGWPGMSAEAAGRSAVLVAAAVRANDPGPVQAGVASC